VKITKKLEIKKVTLRDIDEPKLDAMAGGASTTPCTLNCNPTRFCATGPCCK
jgi:hypothetical protein